MSVNFIPGTVTETIWERQTSRIGYGTYDDDRLSIVACLKRVYF